MAHPITVTDATFEQDVVKADGPVLVDFWAPWCGPCRMVAPVLDQIGDELEGKLTIAKVNVDENQVVMQSLGIMGIPAMFLFKDGKVVEEIVGFQPKPRLMSKIEPHLN